MMKEILLAKYGEVALKGLNRGSFESAMMKTIRRRVERAGDFKVYKAQSTVYVEPLNDNCDMDEALDQLKRVFGISAINRARVTEKNFEAICEAAREYLGPQLKNAKTFRVSAKRSDKKFPMDSMQIGRELGGYLLSKFHHLEVDIHNPDVNVVVEIRDFAAYIHGGKIEAAGGMPTGTSGRAAVMLSGGIDSPVAAWMMAKRGLDLVGVHFMSPPYTSDRALDKAVRLAGVLSKWCGNLPLFCVNFTETQVAIKESAPPELFTVLMRRSMIRICEMLCEKEFCDAMITGESLAQVASQTLLAIGCTDDAAKRPVLRPLIGMDKNEIVEIARRIGTLDISNEQFEDCCTIFTPKHPKTKPRLADILAAEAQMPHLAELEAAAAENYTLKMLHFFDEEVSILES